MRLTRGILFGFIIGTVIGLLIYLRLQREKREQVRERRYLRIHLPDQPRETQPTPPPPAEPQPPPSPSGALEDIRGIGRVRAERLREAGIETLADLAAATPERVREVLGGRVGLESAADFIAEARARSQ